jgi:3-hydroxyacyl-CoA dehydrogenase
MPDAPQPPRPPLARVRDVPLPGVGTLALVTLDDGAGPRRPVTLDLAGLESLRAALDAVAGRVARGEVAALALTGKPGQFAAGADLRLVREVTDEADARALASAGHRAVEALADLPVPTFALIGGPALGGGLELALACDERAVADGVAALGLPEVSLGLVPGWGGCYALPRLVGPAAALEVIVDNPLHGNRLLTAADALSVGLVDAVLPGPGEDAALAWVAERLARDPGVRARRPDPSGWDWAAAVQAARRRTWERVHGAVPAADVAIDLVEAAGTRTRREAHAAEDDALARLVLSDELRAAVYAWDLTTHRARHPAGAPHPSHARPIGAVGLLGAGLMARQLGLLLARRLRVPVTLREIDAARAAAGRDAVLAEVARLRGRGRVNDAEAARLAETIRSTVELADLRGCDLVVEAVVEDIDVKCRVVAEVEDVLDEGAVIATNTSALSVTTMAGAARRPGRVVGMHFFNPVAQMPLVEVVRTDRTDEATLATAFAVVGACGKTAVAVRDAPGFVVNRVLVRMLGEVLGALEEGTALAVADRALWPMGLPMGPFQLLQLVGPAVALHVLEELRVGLGDRFPASPGLARLVADGRALVVASDRPTASSAVDPAIAGYFPAGRGLDEAGLLRRVQDALAQEIGLLLAEGVVREAEDVDLALILGAGWPGHLGGITPYLDRVGAAQRVTGARFHLPGVASAPR